MGAARPSGGRERVTLVTLVTAKPTSLSIFLDSHTNSLE